MTASRRGVHAREKTDVSKLQYVVVMASSNLRVLGATQEKEVREQQSTS